MIGFIIISALLLCGVITLLAILFMRPSEVPISDKSIDLSAVLPIQTITDSVIVNGSGDLTIGYRLFLPEVFTLSQEDAKYIHERLEGLFKMLSASGTNRRKLPERHQAISRKLSSCVWFCSVVFLLCFGNREIALPVS